MTGTADGTAAAAAGRTEGGTLAGFGRAVRAEWTKARTVRATVWTPAAMALLVPALAVFVGATGSLRPDDTVLGGSLTGALLGQLAAAVFGTLAISGEYGTGMIRATFAALPGRGAVLAAKAVVVAAVAFVLALASCTAAFGVGTVMLSGEGYATGRPMPALIGVALCHAATALLGLALGALLRHAAGAVTAGVCLVLVPSLVAPLFGDLERWIAGASPAAALQKLSQTSDASAEAVGSLGGWPSLGLLLAAAGVLLAAATVVLRRRDA
ncbi:ABC transporter permease subunit [Actinomadura rifamycini]|uniref:ABC transporter permease subunit n=1 Tax=Actinomadura rifamycini TaxID=31962 RepID=UPI0004214B76|nr:ABC transporter permease subunit [Actinomadura rifamycini]